MSDYLFLVPISLLLGLIALAAFFWSLRSDQYDDLDGAAERVLVDEDRPLPPPIADRDTDSDGCEPPPGDPSDGWPAEERRTR